MQKRFLCSIIKSTIHKLHTQFCSFFASQSKLFCFYNWQEGEINVDVRLREYLNKRLLNGEFNCEKELTLSIISGKWKIVILWHLGHEGAHRFGELFRLFKNISNRILTKQLRELEQDGIIERHIYDENPPRVEYFMTERGMTLLPIVDAMFDWGKKNMTYYADLAQKNYEQKNRDTKK